MGLGKSERFLGNWLGLIYKYCEENSIPLLNLLAVNKATGIPGVGMHTVIAPEDIPGEWQRIYAFNWYLLRPPSIRTLNALQSDAQDE